MEAIDRDGNTTSPRYLRTMYGAYRWFSDDDCALLSELGLPRQRQGATFEPAKGGHLWVMLRGRRAILPMHGRRKEMKTGTVQAIKKQLGLQ